MDGHALTLTAVYVPAAGLAAYRFGRFLARDALIAGWRDRLTRAAFVGGKLGADPVPVIRDGAVDMRRTMARAKAVYLLFCGYCAGFWLAVAATAAVTVAAPIRAPFALDVIHAAAAAGIACALYRWDAGQPVEVDATVTDATPPRTSEVGHSVALSDLRPIANPPR